MSDKAAPINNAEKAELKTRVELGVNRVLAMSMLAQASGYDGITSYEGQRDYNKVFGYPDAIAYETYRSMYRRGGLAKTVVNLPATSTWRGDITLTVPVEKKGQEKSADAKRFEKEWMKLWKDFNIRNVMLRADKVAGIGNYSVIRIGLTNDADVSEPVNGTNHQLAYLSVFSQINALPNEWETDPNSKNYGGIKQYNLQLNSTSDQYVAAGGTAFPSGEMFPVDASRVVHVAEQLEEDNVYGTPRLQACWNALLDLLKLTGGSAEMYFRGAFPGYNFNLDPEANISTEKLEAMEEQIQNVILGLGRYIQMEGVSVDSIQPQVEDPTSQVAVQMEQITATTRIPKRKLVGTERGELASGMEEVNWNGEIECRRTDDCERWLRALADLLMDAGALTRVEEYIVNWPDLEAEKGLENSQIALNLTKAITEFFNNNGEAGVPVEVFFEEVLNWDKDMAEDVNNRLEGEREDGDNMTADDANAVADIVRQALSRAPQAEAGQPSTDPEDQTATQ